ncbi:flagellar C1a complex subunit C1a-32 [Aureococcus anophagefferens]|nr:flagellar C1a complex subunit C1a-32 [Aureococcus anophagefferens]
MELGFHIKQVDARARVHDFYFYLFAFSRENRFSHEKTSTLLSICRDVFDGDMGTNDPAKHMGTSFERLEGMLLRHAVFRPPKSIGVFDEGDVRSILNFMLHNYYRHWRLYKVCFTRRLQCTFTQAPPAVLEPEPEPEEEGGEAEDGEATGEEPPADEVA